MKHRLSKKLSTLFMTALLSAVSLVPAFAAMEGFVEVGQSDHNAESLITVDYLGEDYIIFSAYVPTVLPIAMDSNGEIFTPSNAAIVNGVTTKGIKVTDVTAKAAQNWSLYAWNAGYFGENYRNSNYLSLSFQEDRMNNSSKFNITSDKWNIPKDSYISLDMEAKIPPMDVAPGTVKQSNIATVEFTFDWSGDDDTTGEKWIGTLE